MSIDRILGMNWSNLDSLLPRDNFTTNSQQKIIIEMSNRAKNQVVAVLSEDIQLSAHAEWGGFISGLTNLVPGLSSIMSLFGGAAGRTLQQPWFSRKQYQSSTPLTFTLPLRFIAANDAKEDVWNNVLALYSYVYPRLIGGSGPIYDNEVNEYASGLNSEAADKVASGATSLSGLFHSYAIPGPGLFGPDSEKQSCDPVTITLGVFGKFTNVYITDVQGTVSHVMDKDGYPISAEVNVTFSVQDSCFVTSDGTFSFSQTEEQYKIIQKNIADGLGKFGTTTLDITKNVTTEATKGALDIAALIEKFLNIFGG